jgi:hypothetical protein
MAELPGKGAAMDKITVSIAACAGLIAAGAALAHEPACEHAGGANAAAMRGRMQTLEMQVERLERSTDPAERRSLAQINMKRMREALGELRQRDLPADCRMEMMEAMLHAMVRNEQAMLADSPD